MMPSGVDTSLEGKQGVGFDTIETARPGQDEVHLTRRRSGLWCGFVALLAIACWPVPVEGQLGPNRNQRWEQGKDDIEGGEEDGDSFRLPGYHWGFQR